MHLNKKNDPCKFIEFSGSTYQMQLVDPVDGSKVWVFLQLDQKGELVDGFCDQEESESEEVCGHLKLALARIYNNHELPLHQRFEKSLWNVICRLYADRLGDNPSRLTPKGRGSYIYESSAGKVVFQVKASKTSSMKLLKEILEHRHRDTEENSLKFSNLSQEELMLWREGQPSNMLKYELSFWSDFAKWLMLHEDENLPYQITFGYASTGLPNRLTVTFDDLEMSFYLSAANLPEIIPALTSVNSPLKVYHAPDDQIKNVTYDKSKGRLCIAPRIASQNADATDSTDKHANGIEIGSWVFVPGSGFFARDPHQLLNKQYVQGSEIAQLLSDHTDVIKKHLIGARVHETLMRRNYMLSFDSKWNLHIIAFLFTPGDLSAPGSRCFGDWVYLDDDGFYPLDKGEFADVDTIIKSADIPEFITQNRTWLNQQQGFHVHLAGVQAQLTYELSSDGKLRFERKLLIDETEGDSKEFGPWLYVASEGFYSKILHLPNTSQLADIVISRDQIPLFIRVNRDDLQLVENFFSSQSPVDSVGIDIEYLQTGDIELRPHYEIKEAYLDKQVLFFDEVSYVHGEGFYELPPEARLPEKFRHQTHISPEDRDLFLSYELDQLRPYAFQISSSLIRPKSMKLIGEPVELEAESQSGFILKLTYATELGNLPVTAIWSAMQGKQRFMLTEAGLIDVSDKRFNWIRWLQKKQIDKRRHTVQLSSIELIRLHAFEDIEINPQKDGSSSSAYDLLTQLREFKIPNDPCIDGLKSSLRPYQLIGLKWLWFLYSHRLSGLLCDDMGLGKTHQTMALITAIQNASDKSSPSRFLVICPTSVLYHWQEKLAAFLPEINVYTYYGADRDLNVFMNGYDLLLTSYGIYRNEVEKLAKINFELAIFDEVQLAKNHSSRIYTTLLNVDAKMRLGLTGTPIENHLRELKTLFDIVLPLYMPGEADYKELFVKPIEKESSKERRLLLSRMIKPFVMRRKKDDVLLDLPAKIEEVAHCDLDRDQAILYNEVLISQRSVILHELEDEKSPIPYMHIFALLSGLKQICNHPALYLKCPQDFRLYHSGKWDLFTELLAEALDSSQKVVVYSQYLGMLDIIQDYLGELGIAYAGIRGSTTNRAEQLKRFKNDPTCQVFVASLQAAGLGVDLTSASVVIHYDRWWNAAREDQATDRVHRIGQTRGVQVFKLITKNTFEERIDELISNKRQLMEDVVSIDDHDVVKQFTRDELIYFLKEVVVPPSGNVV